MRLTWPLALILLSCGQESVFVSMRDPNYPLAVSGPVLRLTLVSPLPCLPVHWH